MIRRIALLCSLAAALLALAVPAAAPAAEAPCELSPRAACFGIASVAAHLSTTQAGAHPNFTFGVAIKQDPESKANGFGLKDSYAPTRRIRIDTPPGLIGDPNVLGAPQQCTAEELSTYQAPGGGCPNGSQVGIGVIGTYEAGTAVEPLYMMQPPGGDVVARLGTIAAVYPTFIDLRVRSEGDYGLVAEVREAPATASLTGLETTIWGVPADPSHDTERCNPAEILIHNCIVSPSRPPGSRPLPFLTNPTRCGAPLSMSVNASSWVEPEYDPAKEVSAPFPTITGCDNLPFGPSLEVEPTTHRAASPSGADVTIRLPKSDGVNVLEPSQMRSLTVQLPEGLVSNPSLGDGLDVCSAAQVGLGSREASHCPNAAKLADTEFDIPVLERNFKGAIYLREPEPGHPFRIWITADDLGLHVKLPGELEVDKATGQITSVTTEIPQAPLREVKLEFKSGFRAPLVTPERCGEYHTAYEFTPWSGGPAVKGSTPMTIGEGCDTGGFDPKLSAGATDPSGGAHSPFVFTLTRQDGEQNPRGLDISLPAGLAATFAGVARCEGADAVSGNCPAGSKIGHVNAAVGAGPAPLWVPQAGKRPTAVYLGGPYKGAPTSIVAVVPKQAGPFDFGDEVVRSAIYVDPRTAQATAKADPLPQLIEGIPIGYRTLHVDLDRPGFTLNPTGCEAKAVAATVTSAQGAVAHPSSPFAAVNCAKLGFKPRLGLQLRGGTKRGDYQSLRAVVKTNEGPDAKRPEANIASAAVTLPHSAFLANEHIRTVCTRVQYAAGAGNGAECPKGSIYGRARAVTPLLDDPLEGPVYLRSSSHPLPDVVVALHGLIDIELSGQTDSVNEGIRNTFASVPDAPATKFVLELFGGKKALIVNSRNLCQGPKQKATAHFTGQNGAVHDFRPVVRNSCKKAKKSKKHRSR